GSSRSNRSHRTAASRPGSASKEPSWRTRRSFAPMARARTSASATRSASNRECAFASSSSGRSSNARSATRSCPRRSRTVTEGNSDEGVPPPTDDTPRDRGRGPDPGLPGEARTFDVVAFRALYNGKRFHMRLETHGLERVPKGSEIDLHVDFMRDVTAFHGSEAESEEIAFEMAQLLGELKAQDPERSRPRVRCPECGKEFGQEAFRAHRMVVHGR